MPSRSLFLLILAFLVRTIPARGDMPYALTYSTYLGGSNWEHARDIYTDAAGFTYIVGGTGSGNFAGASSFSGTNTYNAGQPNSAGDGAFGGCDVFITKMSPAGQVLWTKYMGGANYDRAYALEVDGSGNIYIAGRAGRGFPMVNAMQPTFSGTSQPSSYGDQNAFVAKLDAAGAVLWSTYVGTGELARDIAIDAAGDVYVPLTLAVSSSRTAFNTPELSAFHGKLTNAPPTTNTRDVGLVKLHGNGSGVAWARWIGGSGTEVTNPSIRVNAAGEAHLLFSTTSTNSSLPTVGAVSQTNNGGAEDSYLAKFAADGTSLIFGTYLGGTGTEAHETHSLALDAAGNAVVAIHTSSANFPITPGATNSPTRGANDIAVVKFNASGVRILSAVVGGTGNENPDGIYVDASGRVFIAFETTSTDFPVTPGAFDLTANGSNDGGFIVLSPDFSLLDYATLFGGSAYDNARTLFLSGDGSVYLTGGTLSTNLPTLNAYDSSFNGGSHNFAPGSGDAWVARFSLTFASARAAWRYDYFRNTSNAGSAADNANPDADALMNLWEYLHATHPLEQTVNPQQVQTVANRLALIFPRNTNATDLTVTVQAADNLVGPWTDVARSTGGAPFTVVATGALVSETGTGTTRTVEIRDLYDVNDPAHPQRFLRLFAP